MKSSALSLLLCLLLLTGCTAPVAAGSATVAPAAAPTENLAHTSSLEPLPTPDRSTPLPTDRLDRPSSIPIATPSSPYPEVYVREIALQNDGDPLYLAGTELCPAGELTQHTASLSGGLWTKAQVEALGAAIAGSRVPLKELPEALTVFGLETEGALFSANEAIDGWECTEVFQGDYLHVSLEIEWYSGHVSLFFQRTAEGYIPWSLVDHAATRVGGYGFLRFAGQPFMVYACGGWGSGYHNYRTYWYNLSTRAVELCYMHSFYDEYNVAENVFQFQERVVEQAIPVESKEASYVELNAYLQLGAVYYNEVEGGDVLQYAPEPDIFAAKVPIRLFYDASANAFYLRIPPEVYPLYSETGKAVLRFYFGEQLQALSREGHDFQQQWAATFFEDDAQ